MAGLLLYAYRTTLPQTVLPQVSPEGALFGGVSLSLEFATTSAARERGLSGRTDLPATSAMLFAFPRDDRYGFWMKGMLIPLDIFWLDAQGRVVHVAAEVSPASYPHVFYPPVPARYVLETMAGFARTHAVATGTQLTLQKFPTVTQ